MILIYNYGLIMKFGHAYAIMNAYYMFFYPRANAPAGLGFAFCRRRRDLSKTVYCSCCCHDLSKKLIFANNLYLEHTATAATK